ncbi:uncharacterized protein MYCFIDRAFT_31918 [Pseudocercospora fijiensis CIRAD86]|uniref:phosphoribosylglycinamide formyltransferase 1 n=1 Tax=Pseudocercospora fijiensis (strain CIRAD86) TaxID=383855 RepID=M2ZLM3_PSEFD|nr:uncharacterized protein MYCFIDRAFT_31918 [Pseudocercospora fijiensis CIRAD86]EME79974.1 hypothetical protein MYCFIDRAFT_31918 [Pseudocercospora fijiensis CIRAD86]
MAHPTRITVLISGSGSNLQALIDASHPPPQPPKLQNVQFVRVISDRKSAYGLQRAEKSGIPTAYQGIIPYRKSHPDDEDSARKAYDTDLAHLVLSDSPNLIICAGFMRILTPNFLDPITEAGIPIINLHPSLHGDLVGARCIERAWEEFREGKRTKTGIMVHYVISEVDEGEPILQQEIEMEGCGTLEELKDRVHQAEHVLVVEGARRVVEKGRAA